MLSRSERSLSILPLRGATGMRRLARGYIVLLTAGFLVVTLGAHAAESFEKRLNEANALLESGDCEGALSAYRDLQVEDPESGLLYYDMGCAQYKQAESKAASNYADEAVEAYSAAAKSFEKASVNAGASLRRDVQFNLANTSAQLAKLSVAPGKENEAQKAFEDCIQKYEEFLKRYPDDQAARNNLDHMRYYLKKMLQNPPPPQENQQQKSGDQQQDQQQDQQKQDSQQDENQQQQQQNQQGQQQSQEDQQKQNEQQQQQAEQSKQESQEKQEQQQDQQQQASGEQQQQQEQQQAKEGEEESKPKDKQTIEALLQSLEDLDQREQYEVRQGDVDNRLRKEWW